MSFVVHLKVAKLHYRAAVLICRLLWNMINVTYKAETLYFRPLPVYIRKFWIEPEHLFGVFFLEVLNNQGCTVTEPVNNKVKVVKLMMVQFVQDITQNL